jgi:hypothetical protein
MSSDPQILEKIKKLLRVNEERGCSPAEVEQALMAAQRLAARHDVNLDEIDATEEITINNEPLLGQEFRPERTGGGECAAKLPMSHKFISMILQRYFKVSLIEHTKWGDYTDKGVTKQGCRKSIEIFGRQTNVSIAIYVYGFLHREFTERWHEHRKNHFAPMSSRGDFFYGVFIGLNAKLRSTMGEVEKEMQQQLEAHQAGKSLQLMIVSEKERHDQALKEAHPRLKYVHHAMPELNDYDALRDGREQGRKIEIKTALKS